MTKQIDKDSWFRLKHRTRLEREAKEDEEKKEINELNARDGNRIKIIKARLGKCMTSTLLHVFSPSFSHDVNTISSISLQTHHHLPPPPPPKSINLIF